MHKLKQVLVNHLVEDFKNTTNIESTSREQQSLRARLNMMSLEDLKLLTSQIIPAVSLPNALNALVEYVLDSEWKNYDTWIEENGLDWEKEMLGHGHVYALAQQSYDLLELLELDKIRVTIPLRGTNTTNTD